MLKNAIWLFVLTLLVFFFFLPSYTNMQDLRQRNLDYQKQIEYLRQKNTLLIEEKRRLIEDPLYLERVAREKLGITKEGEVIYKIKSVSD